MSVCPLFGGLVRFFSFIIDKKQPLLRLFLYMEGGEPLGYPKRAEGTHRAAGTSLLPKAKTSHHRFYMVPFREIATLRSQ